MCHRARLLALGGKLYPPPAEERLGFIRLLQRFADRRGMRVTLLSGDAHVGGVGRLYSRPKYRDLRWVARETLKCQRDILGYLRGFSQPKYHDLRSECIRLLSSSHHLGQTTAHHVANTVRWSMGVTW